MDRSSGRAYDVLGNGELRECSWCFTFSLRQIGLARPRPGRPRLFFPSSKTSRGCAICQTASRQSLMVSADVTCTVTEVILLVTSSKMSPTWWGHQLTRGPTSLKHVCHSKEGTLTT
jgi:hypothetical protein